MKHIFFKRLISYALLFALLINAVSGNIVYANTTASGTVDILSSSYRLGDMVQAKINVNANVKGWIAYWIYDGVVAEEATRKTVGTLSGTFEMGTVNFPKYTGICVYFYDNDSLSGSPLSTDVKNFSISSPVMTWNGHSYAVYYIELPWHEAKAFCEQLKGYLVTITSEDEQIQIENLLSGSPNGSYWLGGTDEEVEGVWKWITGEVWNYTNWTMLNSIGGREPNNGNGGIEENALALYNGTSIYNNVSGSWNDADENIKLSFICEWNTPTIPPPPTNSPDKVVWDNPTSYGSYDNIQYHPASLWGLWGLSGNFMHSGMTIDKWKYAELPDGSVDVTFTVYNSKATAGEVLVYDDKNVLVKRKIIEAYQELPENITEYAFNETGELIKNFFALFGNMEKIGTTTTNIKINIPKNGYIIIHNDANLSSRLKLLYILDQVDRALSACSTVVSGAKNVISIDGLVPILEDMANQSKTQEFVAEILLKSNNLLVPLSSKVHTADELLSITSLISQVSSELFLKDTDFASKLTNLGVTIAGDKAEGKLKEFLYTSGVIPGLIYDSTFLTLGGFNFAYAIQDYKSTMSSGYVRIDNFEPQIIARIACPVDVTVKYNGEVISSVVDNFNTRTEWGRLFIVGDNKDEKILAINTSKALDIVLTGTGKGTMDYSIEFLDTDFNSQAVYAVSDVPITAKTVISTNTNRKESLALLYDENGDGKTDKEIALTSTNSENVYTYPTPTQTQTAPTYLPPKDGYRYAWKDGQWQKYSIGTATTKLPSATYGMQNQYATEKTWWTIDKNGKEYFLRDNTFLNDYAILQQGGTILSSHNVPTPTQTPTTTQTPTPKASTEVAIYGSVYNEVTYSAVSRAKVQLCKSDHVTVIETTYTDNSGKYSFNTKLEQGTHYEIQVTAEGFDRTKVLASTTYIGQGSQDIYISPIATQTPAPPQPPVSTTAPSPATPTYKPPSSSSINPPNPISLPPKGGIYRYEVATNSWVFDANGGGIHGISAQYWDGNGWLLGYTGTTSANSEGRWWLTDSEFNAAFQELWKIRQKNLD